MVFRVECWSSILVCHSQIKFDFKSTKLKKNIFFACLRQHIRIIIFILKKSQELYKYFIYVEHLHNPFFYIKEHLPQRNCEIRMCFWFYFKLPKWAKITSFLDYRTKILNGIVAVFDIVILREKRLITSSFAIISLWKAVFLMSTLLISHCYKQFDDTDEGLFHLNFNNFLHISWHRASHLYGREIRQTFLTVYQIHNMGWLRSQFWREMVCIHCWILVVIWHTYIKSCSPDLAGW